MRVAALTMVYNEPVWAGVWARHYVREVGAENCYLLDHGSDDGSTAGLGIHVERLKRSALDEEARALLVGERAAALLARYDAVVHTDADELLLADPREFKGLLDFAERSDAVVGRAAGFDVQHVPDVEGALDPRCRVGTQRGWLRFSAAMCKPAFVRRPVRWTPGFHSCDLEAPSSSLFLLHLRFVDLELGLRRLARTRQLSFANAETNPHQRVSDEAFATMMLSVAQLPRKEVELAVDAEPLRSWLQRVGALREAGGPWLNVSGDELWAVPEYWRSRF